MSNKINEDLSLKEVFYFLKDFVLLVLKKWYVPLLSVAIVFTFYKIQQYITPKRYISTYKYTVNEDNSSQSFGGLLGAFGFGGGSNTNLQKIIDLSKSRNLLQDCLFKKVQTVNDSNYIANEIIALYKLDEKLTTKNNNYSGFTFIHNDFSKFSRKDKKMLKFLYSHLITGIDTEPLFINDFDVQTSILKLSTETINENLSYQLSKIIFNQLSTFYEEKSIGKQKETFNVLKSKRDSIANLLHETEYKLAVLEDSNLGTYLKTEKLSKKRLSRDITKYSLILAKVSENLEIIDFQLKDKKAFFEIIEDPMTPLSKKYLKNSTIYLYSLFLGMLFSLSYLFFFLLYKKHIQD